VPGGARRVTARGNLYHPQCLTCSVCGRQLDKESGFYHLPPDRLVCEDEIKREKRAEKKDSMKCSDCGESLEGTYFQHEGKNLCEKDYEKYRKKCSVCGCSITGSYYTGKEGKIICAKDYKEQQGGNLNCKKCGKEVDGGEIVRAVDSLFHTECFSCCKCSKNLAGKDASFMADDEKNIYCREDYHKKFSPRCHGCHEPIAPKPGEKSASRLKALDKDWHPQCFKCADCKDRLGGEEGKKCYPMNDEPLCMDCHKKRLEK